MRLCLQMIVACCLIRGKCNAMHSCGGVSQVALPAGDPRLPPRLLHHLSTASGSSDQDPRRVLLSSPRRELEERYFIYSFITSFPSWPWAQRKLLRTTSRIRPGSWDNKSTKASSLSPICWIKLLISPEHPQPCHPSFFLSSHPSAFTLEKNLVTTHHFQLKDTGFWSHRDASGDALNV